VVYFIEREVGMGQEMEELDSKASGPRGWVSSRGRFVVRRWLALAGVVAMSVVDWIRGETMSMSV
jgi:hypothetical protein